MKSAISDHLHDAAIGLREPQAQRHAARESESAAGQSDIAARPRAGDVFLQDGCVADRLVHDSVVLRQFSVQGCEEEGGIKRARDALVGARGRAALRPSLAFATPACDSLFDAPRHASSARASTA